MNYNIIDIYLIEMVEMSFTQSVKVFYPKQILRIWLDWLGIRLQETSLLKQMWLIFVLIRHD